MIEQINLFCGFIAVVVYIVIDTKAIVLEVFAYHRAGYSQKFPLAMRRLQKWKIHITFIGLS